MMMIVYILTQIGMAYIGIAAVIAAISTVDEVKSCDLNIGVALATAVLWLPLTLIVLRDITKEVVNE